MSDQPLKGTQSNFTPPAVMNLAIQEKAEQVFQNMRRQMTNSSSYEALVPVKIETDIIPSSFSDEETNELSYDY